MEITHNDRIRAQNKARYALKKGLLQKELCEVCSDPNSEMHHDDYKKPLQVRWLCRRHHHFADKKVRAKAKGNGDKWLSSREIPEGTGMHMIDPYWERKIEPAKIYTVTELERERIFPWALQHRTIVSMIKMDMFDQNILEAEIQGEGRGTRYLVQGENIIRFMKKYGSVLIGSVRKSKQYGKTNRDS